MGDILTINGVNFCNSTVNVNSVTVANTLNIDSIVKDCGGGGCYPCGPLQFSVSVSLSEGSCDEACVGECAFYYTKDYGTAYDGKPTGCTECSLGVGVPLYSDTMCTPVIDGYYSPNNCGVDCNKCYIVMGGLIVAVKTCATSCNPCDNGVMLSFNESSCELACEETFCRRYWSDGNCDLCPLIVGDYLYTTQLCAVPLAGYYSNKRCIEDEDCEICYEVDVTGKIVAVTSCEPVVSTCRPLNMTIIAQETCGEACNDMSCITRWTDRPVGQLVQAGDYIYDNNSCTCPDDSWSSSDGFWQVWGLACAESPIPPYYNQCVYIPGESCQIGQVQSCVVIPHITKAFDGQVGTTRNEDLGDTLTVYLIEVKEATYTIDLTLDNEVVMEGPIMEEPVTNYSNPFDLTGLEYNTYQIRITSENPEQPIYTQSFKWPVEDG